MARVIYAPAADDDLADIVAHIAQDKPDAAMRWLKKLRKTCDTFATQPKMGEQRPGFGVKGCRCFSVGNYVVFFRPSEDGIEVARIIHGNRDLRNIKFTSGVVPTHV